MRNSGDVVPMSRVTMMTLFGLWLFAAAAAAQDGAAPAASAHLPPLASGSLVALLPTSGNGPAGAKGGAKGGGTVESGSDETLQTLSDTLRRKGFRVLLPAQVSARLVGHTPDGCRNPATCDPELARATLGADAVISSAVWQRPNSPSQVVVHVRRARGFGQAEVNVGQAGAKGLRAATEAALAAALEDSQRTHEIRVEIDSQPSGAKLLIDQTLSAQTPAQLSLLPGNHLVSLEAPGHVGRAQYIEVPEQASGPLRYRLQLVAANSVDADAAAVPPPSAAAPLLPEAPAARPGLSARDFETGDSPAAPRAISSWNYIAAVVLFAVAIPLLANAIYSAATEGDCAGEIDPLNRCAERVRLGPAFYTSLIVGGAALAGATTFLVVRPISSEVDTSHAGAGAAPAQHGGVWPRGVALQLRHAF